MGELMKLHHSFARSTLSIPHKVVTVSWTPVLLP